MPVTPASASLHGALLENNSPDWLIDASPERRQALKDHAVPTPDWYRQATREQRAAVGTAVAASLAAQNRLDKVMAGLQTIDAFAEPLLVKALKDQYKVELDLNSTVISLKQPLEWGIQGTDVGTYEVLRLPLLQAALHNFEASEAEDNAFHASSGFLTQTAGVFTALDTPLTVTQFTRLCRELDIGAKYQSYLKDFFKPDEGQALRLPFIDAQKTALRTAAELALLKKDILPADYSMILQVIDGATDPRMGDQQVWFRDLFMMKRRMTGCVLFIICEKYRYPESLILYIPNDPLHPLKRYTFEGMRAMFKQRFTTRDAAQPRDGRPTPEQRQFSRFVAYADLPHYFQTFTKDAADLPLVQKISPYLAIANKLLQGINPFAGFQHLPEVPVDQQPNDDPFLAPAGIPRKGEGLWSENIELWGYLFEQYRDKLIADARSHAVPTADVDARVRSEKLANLLNIGMLALTTVAMFVPVLGEVTMVAMAGQLMSQTFEASIEWSEGDIQAAKAHLIDVAENLAFIALTAAAGKTLGKLTAAKAPPVIEQLDAVTLANGERRLWKPDLRGYQRPVTVDRDVPPSELGQFEFDGQTHVRLDEQFYRKAYDPELKRWRVEHAGDPGAYRPPLAHNGRGAWRHVHERPQNWDRLTLLRRMGPVTDRFSDEQLLQIADVSGASDNALRKMHLDNAAPPPELADALRLFEADQDVAQVIAQIDSGQAIDDRYLFILPLVTELPRWPAGRVLQVFEGVELSGPSLRYGSERRLISAKRKAPIRISRADVLSGELPARILAALDESEISRLLGGEPARVKEARPAEFRKQIADFARTRQPALFESLYKGAGPVAPPVAKLQRLCPGLSESAAHSVLAQASAEEIARLNSSAHAPLRLLEQGRWYAQQGRVSQALVGLHTPNLLSADSKRLALHTLARLPGWSGRVRLEIRDGHIEGALIDGIGDPASEVRKYLVKKGPVYQAFNDRGETLNGLPREGDNFYASILHALPDDARQALGIPGVAQGADLQRAIIERAIADPQESKQLLRESSAPKPWFKPPQCIGQQRLGYPASGDAHWPDAELIARVRTVYPGLVEADARRLLLDQWRLGKNRQQIVQWLEERLHEWQTLEATLQHWVGDDVASHYVFDSKQEVAEALKSVWRNAPVVANNRAMVSRLNLYCNAPLPLLTADFSFLHALIVGGTCVADASLEGFLGMFPKLRKLTLTATNETLRTLPAALDGLSELTHLNLSANFPLDAQEMTRLENMTRLQSLHLRGVLPDPNKFDVSRLTGLRNLVIAQQNMLTFVKGALELPALERLDLRGTSIGELPQALLNGQQDKLLSGLSMEWFWFSRKAFKPVYEYVSKHPRHLIDLGEMVRGYCRGRLGSLSNAYYGAFLSARATPFARLFEAFLDRWEGASARFDAIEAVLDQYGEFDRRLSEWRDGMSAPKIINLGLTVPTMKISWYEGLLHRYGVPSYSPKLELPRVTADELPQFAAEDFAHVTTLSLREMRAPLEQVRRFLGNFSQVENLDLGGARFADVEFSRQGVDVGALEHLKALNLSCSNLEHWPTGARHLNWLDLSHSRINTVPDAVLADEAVAAHAPHGPAAVAAGAGSTDGGACADRTGPGPDARHPRAPGRRAAAPGLSSDGNGGVDLPVAAADAGRAASGRGAGPAPATYQPTVGGEGVAGGRADACRWAR